MRPADIRPAQPIRPVKRRWYAPQQQRDEDAPQTEPPAETPPLRDSDDEHIDEYAR